MQILKIKCWRVEKKKYTLQPLGPSFALGTPLLIVSLGCYCPCDSRQPSFSKIENQAPPALLARCVAHYYCTRSLYMKAMCFSFHTSGVVYLTCKYCTIKCHTNKIYYISTNGHYSWPFLFHGDNCEATNIMTWHNRNKFLSLCLLSKQEISYMWSLTRHLRIQDILLSCMGGVCVCV